MAVKIRLKRMGRKNRPHYRVCVFDSRTKRDGAEIELLGHYDPAFPKESHSQIDAARAEYWISKGAQVSNTVASLLRGARKAAAAGSAPSAPAGKPTS